MKRTNSSKVKPITPAEAMAHKVQELPDEVINAFNSTIIKNMKGIRSSFKQDDILKEIVSNMSASGRKVTHMNILDNAWLDVEDIYRKSGWSVMYEKGDWGTDDPSMFTFAKKTNG